jgi:hypothetical protein
MRKRILILITLIIRVICLAQGYQFFIARFARIPGLQVSVRRFISLSFNHFLNKCRCLISLKTYLLQSHVVSTNFCSIGDF